jgi:peptide/nickel transport system permease protein
MTRLVARRVLRTVPVLLGVSVLIFLSIRLIPGDPALILAGDRATGEMIEQLRTDPGLNRPLSTQYAIFVKRALAGDLGVSIRTGQPVTTELMRRYPLTLLLAGAAMLFSVAVGFPLGILAAVHRGRWIDKTSVIVAWAPPT